MVLGIGFLLLVSLIVTAGMAAFGKYMTSHVGNVEWLWQIANNIISFGVIALLFALMFKYLPDVKIDWKDVWAGAFVTALLFTIGKYLLGMYIGKSSLVSTYAAAGSLIVVLLWVYYSAQILFYGAELTQVFACESGRRAQPTSNAIWDDSKKAGSGVTNWEGIKKEEAKKEKEEKEEAGVRLPSGLPQHAYGSAASHETGTPHKKMPGAAWASVGVLLFLVFPLERWFSKRVKP
jgi:membrane protein